MYFYINLRSLVSFFLRCISFPRYFSIKSCIFCFTFNFSKLFCSGLLENFVVLPAILLPIKSPVASADFWIALFEAVLSASVADCLAKLKSFFNVFTGYVFTYIFTNIFSHICSKRQISITFYKNSISRLNWIRIIFVCYTLFNN